MPFRAGSWANVHSALVTFSFAEKEKDTREDRAISPAQLTTLNFLSRANARIISQSYSYKCAVKLFSEYVADRAFNLLLNGAK